MLSVAWYGLALLCAVFGVVVSLGVHEVAHAVPIVVAGGTAHVTIGSDSGRTAQFGPVTVTFGYDGVRQLMQYGHYEPTGVDSKRVHAVAIAAGPLATLAVITLLAVTLSHGVRGPAAFGLTFVLCSELYRAVQTIVPKTYANGPYAGVESDGKRLLRLIRS